MATPREDFLIQCSIIKIDKEKLIMLLNKKLTNKLGATQKLKRKDKFKLFVGNNFESANQQQELENLIQGRDAQTSANLKKVLTEDQKYAYIAGLIEGDGSIYCLLANRIKDGYRFGYEIRPCASITQRPEKQHVLTHVNNLLDDLGTLRRRNDNIASLDFSGKDKVLRLVPFVKPYLYLKHRQAKIIVHVIEQMPYVRNDPQKFLNLCRIVDLISKENDGNNLKNTSETVRQFLLSKGYEVV